MAIKFLWEDQSVGREGEFRGNLSLPLLFFRFLQFKIILRQRVQGGHILLSFIYIIILLDGADKLIKDANYASRLEVAKIKKLYCTKLRNVEVKQ